MRREGYVPIASGVSVLCEYVPHVTREGDRWRAHTRYVPVVYENAATGSHVYTSSLSRLSADPAPTPTALPVLEPVVYAETEVGAREAWEAAYAFAARAVWGLWRLRDWAKDGAALASGAVLVREGKCALLVGPRDCELRGTDGSVSHATWDGKRAQRSFWDAVGHGAVVDRLSAKARIALKARKSLDRRTA